eukprot:5683973-Lingulodinium_polyedra.AAC.1
MPTRRPFAATSRRSPSSNACRVTGRKPSGPSGWAPRASTPATANAFNWQSARPTKHRNKSHTVIRSARNT